MIDSSYKNSFYDIHVSLERCKRQVNSESGKEKLSKIDAQISELEKFFNGSPVHSEEKYRLTENVFRDLTNLAKTNSFEFFGHSQQYKKNFFHEAIDNTLNALAPLKEEEEKFHKASQSSSPKGQPGVTAQEKKAIKPGAEKANAEVQEHQANGWKDVSGDQIKWTSIVATDKQRETFKNLLKNGNELGAFAKIILDPIFAREDPHNPQSSTGLVKLFNGINPRTDKPYESIMLENGEEFTAEEQQALAIYSSECYMLLNNAIANSLPEVLQDYFFIDNSLQEEVRKMSLDICVFVSSALNKLPDAQGHLTRGASLHKDALPSYKVGQEFSELKFLSFTYENPTESAKWAIQTGIKWNEEPVMFVCTTKEGAKDISRFSISPDEAERTYGPGASFEISKIEKDAQNNLTVIYISEK